MRQFTADGDDRVEAARNGWERSVVSGGEVIWKLYDGGVVIGTEVLPADLEDAIRATRDAEIETEKVHWRAHDGKSLCGKDGLTVSLCRECYLQVSEPPPDWHPVGEDARPRISDARATAVLKEATARAYLPLEAFRLSRALADPRTSYEERERRREAWQQSINAYTAAVRATREAEITELVKAARAIHAYGHSEGCFVALNRELCDCGWAALDAALRPFQNTEKHDA